MSRDDMNSECEDNNKNKYYIQYILCGIYRWIKGNNTRTIDMPMLNWPEVNCVNAVTFNNGVSWALKIPKLPTTPQIVQPPSDSQQK